MNDPPELFKAADIVSSLHVLSGSATHHRLGSDLWKGKRTMREGDHKPAPKGKVKAVAELITPEYIPAEVFLENMGFFYPVK